MKSKRKNRIIATSRLISESNIFSAIGSILNLGGSDPIYNYSETPDASDREALASDWKMTGQDIRHAIKKVAY